MKNTSLQQDYIKRAKNRLIALEKLVELESWADVVRESQEVVELALKAMLQNAQIAVPRIHDVSQILLEHASRFSEATQKHLKQLAAISHDLRRDRELSFYGSDDLTPSEFYTESDAKEAFKNAKFVVETVQKEVT